MPKSHAEVKKELEELFPKPETPQSPAPDYHVPDHYTCSYGWISHDADNKTIWLDCNCEDPSNPWPPRGATDGPKECHCYFCWGKPRADRGRDPCENFDHHCEMCHEAGHCTALTCQET